VLCSSVQTAAMRRSVDARSAEIRACDTSAPNAVLRVPEDDRMGDVAIQYRLLPDSPDANIDELIEKIKISLPEGVRLNNHEMKPFAFGLNAIEILVIMKDEAGISDQTENALSSISGIQSVEALEMSLI